MKNTFIYLSLVITLFSCKKTNTEPTNNQSTTPTEVTPTIGKPGPNITDVDGNTYKTVIIGTQQWMAENLRVSKYNDGTPIPSLTSNTQWSNFTSGAWAYYNNDVANNAKYGKLYNWYAVSPTTNGYKNICPTGWHVATDSDWTVLTDYLGGASVAGGKMKEKDTANWNSPNISATNTSLFTALPGGQLNPYGGSYNIGGYGLWWSATEDVNGKAWYRTLSLIDGVVGRGSFDKRSGYSVRCIKD